MTTEQLINVLQENIDTISAKLSRNDIQKLYHLIDALDDALDHDINKIEDRTDDLLDFCIEYPFIKETMTGVERKILVKTTLKENMRVLKNKLIDADEEKKNEQTNH